MADITSPTYTVATDSDASDQYAIVRRGQLRKQTRAALLSATDESAIAALRKGGTTAARPDNPEPYEMYFDDTLGYPIWWSGIEWVDATGAAV